MVWIVVVAGTGLRDLGGKRERGDGPDFSRPPVRPGVRATCQGVMSASFRDGAADVASCSGPGPSGSGRVDAAKAGAILPYGRRAVSSASTEVERRSVRQDAPVRDSEPSSEVAGAANFQIGTSAAGDGDTAVVGAPNIGEALSRSSRARATPGLKPGASPPPMVTVETASVTRSGAPSPDHPDPATRAPTTPISSRRSAPGRSPTADNDALTASSGIAPIQACFSPAASAQPGSARA